MTMYDRIRDLRIRNGMSQDDLAKATGYKDRSMITKIEAGKVDLSQRKITAFANALGTTPAYLMGWESAPIMHEPIQIYNASDDDNQSSLISELTDKARQMSDEDIELLIAMADRIIGRDQK